MPLSEDLISRFVKATKDDVVVQKETTVKGTVVVDSGLTYVRLDGSDQLTPISTTVNVSDGDRVNVSIINHAATISGNNTSPSASSKDLTDIGNQISEFEIVIAGKVDATELAAERGRIDNLVVDNVLIREELTAESAKIEKLETEKLTAIEADIDSLEANKLDASIADITYATIENLQATNAEIYNLNSTYGEFVVLTGEKLTALEGSIGDLDVHKLSVDSARALFANIDFANIGEAAIGNFFAKSGLIEDITVGDGTVTGKLVGVTISGDLIEGNTIKADKLVIKGEDGVYYKLNVDTLGETTIGGLTTEEQTELQNGLHGTAIIAKSITADKISVTDLVAFGATIGGFAITDNSLYSGVKSSVHNTTRGSYLDNTGQMAFGDSDNYVKGYIDNDEYHVEVKADTIILGGSDQNIQDVMDETEASASSAQDAVENITERLGGAETIIDNINNQLQNLVVDENGASLMTQVGGQWIFSTSNISTSVNNIRESLNELVTQVGITSSAVNILQQTVGDHGSELEYITIGSYEGRPSIELGESDSDHKLIITNTDIAFRIGTNVPTHIDTSGVITDNITIKKDLIQDYYRWSVRENGNYGLSWTGGANLLNVYGGDYIMNDCEEAPDIYSTWYVNSTDGFSYVPQNPSPNYVFLSVQNIGFNDIPGYYTHSCKILSTHDCEILISVCDSSETVSIPANKEIYVATTHNVHSGYQSSGLNGYFEYAFTIVPSIQNGEDAYIEFSKIKIERGSTATPWCPAVDSTV